MTERRSTEAPVEQLADTLSDDLPKPVTGVAGGSEGTGTALDDTQLYDVSTFTPIEAGRSEPVAGSEPVAVPEPVEDSEVVGRAQRRTTAAASAPAPVRPARRASVRQPSTSRTIPLAIKAGLITAALALAVLVGASLAGSPSGVAGDGGLFGQGPSVTVAPIVEPTAEATDGGGDGGGSGGNGRGNGCGNGRGNGNNC